jgi:hypothetical protein
VESIENSSSTSSLNHVQSLVHPFTQAFSSPTLQTKCSVLPMDFQVRPFQWKPEDGFIKKPKLVTDLIIFHLFLFNKDSVLD